MQFVTSRRGLLQAFGSAVGLGSASISGWLPVLAASAAQQPAPQSARRRQCVLLWMPGGPSQIDTFDPKPHHVNGGTFREIATSIPGLGVCEHLPKLAAQAERLAIIRGLSTKEGDHGRGTFLMRTGHQPGGPVRFPCVGSSLAKALGDDRADLPNFVSIAPYTLFNAAAFGSGFLGPKYAPLTVGAADRPRAGAPGARYPDLGVDDLAAPPGISARQADGRLALWRTLENDFVARHRSASPIAHDTVYQRAVRMMRSDSATAFDLDEEPAAVREAYGRGRFGQGCLMARRLIERGVPFVEVALGGLDGGALGWDTHQDNFATVRRLCGELDAGWSTLMTELAHRGLLESTTLIWMGEFGRTPRINNMGGRDHFPAAWSCVLAGGGVHGGQAYGRTSADGMTVEDRQVSVGDVLATLCAALGLAPDFAHISDIGRPIRLAEGEPIQAILA